MKAFIGSGIFHENDGSWWSMQIRVWSEWKGRAFSERGAWLTKSKGTLFLHTDSVERWHRAISGGPLAPSDTHWDRTAGPTNRTILSMVTTYFNVLHLWTKHSLCFSLKHRSILCECVCLTLLFSSEYWKGVKNDWHMGKIKGLDHEAKKAGAGG